MKTLLLILAVSAFAQEQAAPRKTVLIPGTKIPMNMLNSVSTKHAAEGDRIYLETIFPIMVDGKVVIPVGSNVAGTVTSVKRPGRVKGRGELYVRFDSLILPNGVVRDFRARMGSLDGRANEDFDRKEGKVTSEGNKAGDAQTIGTAATTGTMIGTVAGSAAGRAGMGAGIGAAAGATAGMISVLMSRGPEAMIAKGSTLEMVLDRSLEFTEEELNFGNTPARRVQSGDSGTGPLPSVKQQGGSRMPGAGRFPL